MFPSPRHPQNKGYYPLPQPLSLPTAESLSREARELPQTLIAAPPPPQQGGSPAALISSSPAFFLEPGGQAHHKLSCKLPSGTRAPRLNMSVGTAEKASNYASFLETCPSCFPE